MFGRSIGARDRAIFFKGLGLLFGSGVRLTRAFELLGVQAEIPEMALVCRSISKRVEAGSNLYQAMASHPEAFPRLQLRLIQVAQATGSLPAILQRLADYEERSHGTEHRVRSSLAYPSLILVACLATVLFLPPYLFGSLGKLLDGQELPLITRLVMALSHFLSSPLFFVLLTGAVAVSTVGWRMVRERDDVQLFLSVWLLRVPVLGRVLRWLVVARFARALEVMLRVGVPIHHALDLAGGACGNRWLERELKGSIQALIAGATVAQALRQTTFFPSLFLQAVKAGEESGALSQMLGRMADLYELELEASLERFLALLEPLVMLLMGIVAGVLIIATTLPLMEVIRSL